MIEIDFVTTSINNVEILEKTYDSYSKNLIDLNLKDCRLILNIDPMPNNENIDDILRVAKLYFKTVLLRVSDECNFTKSNLWCLSQVKTDYFFYIQSNKCVKQKISIKHMLNLFDTDVVSVCLSPIVSSGIFIYLSWHPNLWKTQWIKEVYLKHASENVSSEYQLREIGLLEDVKSICYLKDNDVNYFLKHIGKEYKNNNNYFFGNLSSDKDIEIILKKENWHKYIYDVYKDKNVEKNIWNNFIRKVYGDSYKIQKWYYRWTGKFGYGSLENKEYITRNIIKNGSP